MGTRNHSSSAENAIFIGGDTNRLEGWPSNDGEAGEDKAKASLTRAGWKTCEGAQSGQIRWVLCSHTGMYFLFLWIIFIFVCTANWCDYCFFIIIVRTMVLINEYVYPFQKGLKNVFDEAILAALEPPEPVKKRKCVLL